MESKNTLQPNWQDIGGNFVAINNEHRFGTDAVLLEDFAKALKKDIVCEIGTGCGIIPVLMCKNGRGKKIYAVDIEPCAADLAQMAVEKNNLENVEIICADANDIKYFDEKIGAGNLSLVVCNPPYYKENSGGDYKKEQRAQAREEATLSIDAVCKFASRFLKFGGRFCVCYKPERLCDLFYAMRQNDIEPKKIRYVQKEINTSPWLCLVEGKKGAKSFLKTIPSLVMNSKEGIEEIKKIYGEIKNKQE